ncbi:hypothetical protein Tco_0566350 [Tanacetum coccineum]
MYHFMACDKGKGIMIEEHVVEQAKVKVDYQLAQRLQAQEQEELTDEEKTWWRVVQREQELEQEVTKNQKVDDVQETAEVDNDQEAAKIKELIKIVFDKEEVAIDAIPLVVKPPSIVDWKIHKEGKKTYYQIIIVDGSLKMYLVFSHMLKSFDREDLETQWKLVKAKHGSTRPEEGYERVIWGDLKGRIVGIKRLLDDLRVTAAKLNYYCSKIKTAERLSTVRERIKTEERKKIV